MRICSHSNDPGYGNFTEILEQGLIPVVSLDGQEQSNCFAADPDAGYVDRYKVDGKGNVIPDLPMQELQWERVYGVVEVATIKRNG